MSVRTNHVRPNVASINHRTISAVTATWLRCHQHKSNSCRGTQILGVVQPGATLSTGSTPRLLLPAQRGCEPVVPRAVAWHESPVPTTFRFRSNHVPFTFQPRSAFFSSVCHWSSHPVILSSLSCSDRLESNPRGVPARLPTAIRRS